MKRKQNTIRSVSIDSLIENPNNPNRMSKTSFAKLVRNIERTGLYEPIIVRKANSRDSEHRTQYEIINGHQRVQALRQLGYKNADVCIWDINEQQCDILVATLNRLSGKAILDKKLAILSRLSKKLDAKKLAELLPLTAGQIKRYRNLKPPEAPQKPDRDTFAEPVVFFVNESQKKFIDRAIQKLRKTIPNKSITKAEAITQIARKFTER
jgi:ParB-like chromosome segregation protein Spo0J